MRKLGLIILVFILLSAVFYARYRNDIIQPIPTPSSTPSATPTNSGGKEIVDETPPPDEGIVIGPGESAEVQCGEGNDGVRTQWKGKGGGYTSLNGQVELMTELLDANLQPAKGALITWRLYDWGSLRINGCNATFTAPDAIGLAYSTSATISARVELPRPSPTSGGGEGGPINAGYSTSARITIYKGGATPTCHDPAGVAISINSVPTTSNVQIRVDTPTVVGRVYNRRNATVRDGAGIYEIQIFVNGALYGETALEVKDCQLPPVKF